MRRPDVTSVLSWRRLWWRVKGMVTSPAGYRQQAETHLVTADFIQGNGF